MENKTTGRNEELLANGPILKTMLTLGIPVFIAQFINILYNVVDRMYIGHIPETGAMALTGVGVCFPILTLIMAFSSLIGAGGAPLAGIAFGKGNKDKAEKILGNSATALFVLSIILTLFFQIIKKPFLFMFGASQETYRYAGEYLTIYLCGTVFVMLALGLNAYITVQGEAKISMVTVLIGAVLNLILDPIFIFVFNMGVKGAAIATVISQAVSAAWVVKFLSSRKAVLRIRRKNLKLSGDIIKEIMALGVSPFVMSATESLIVVIFNRGALIYGNDLYVGSMTILQSALQIIFVPLNGFTQGVSPIISYSYGAGNFERVKKVCYTLIAIAGSSCFILSGLFILFPGRVAACFTTDADLIAICIKMLPIFICGMLIFGLQSGCQTCFMALGKAKQAFFFAVLRKVILLSPLALILPAVTHNILGLYIAEPISDSLSAITCFIVFLITLRREEKKEP